jgi:hypothetical protein
MSLEKYSSIRTGRGKTDIARQSSYYIFISTVNVGLTEHAGDLIVNPVGIFCQKKNYCTVPINFRLLAFENWHAEAGVAYQYEAFYNANRLSAQHKINLESLRTGFGLNFCCIYDL